MIRRVHTLPAILILTALYFAAGKFGLSWAVVHPSASAVWPPSGIALAALLLYGSRLWPAVFLGAFLVNITTHGSAATTLAIAAGNTVEAVLGAWLIGRFAGGPKVFDRTKTILQFILFAMLSTALGGSLGATSLSLGGFASGEQYPAVWLTWWLGDLVSLLIITPLLVIWVRRPLSLSEPRRILEAGLLLLTVLIVGGVVFLSKIPSGLEYLTVPPVLWAAFRFAERGAVTTAFLLSAMAVWGAARGLGPFAIVDPVHSFLLLQFFIGTIAMTALVLASVVSARTRAEQRLLVEDAVSRILAESPALREAGSKILQVLCEKGGGDVGALWNVDRNAREVACVELWHGPAVNVTDFETLTRNLRLAPGAGLPGRVWHSGEPLWVSDVTRDSNFKRTAAARKDKLHAAFCFPIKLRDEVLGVVECFSREIREPDEHFLRMVASIGDQLGAFIERKRAEEVLRENEGRLRAVLSTGRIGTWEWNIAADQITWSPSLEEIHGLKSGTFGGRFEDFQRDIHPEDLERVLAQIQSALEQRGDYQVAYRIIRPSGEPRWLEAFGSIVFGADDKPQKLLGVCMDVTERKVSEEILRAKESQLRLITDTAPVLLVHRDRDERYKFVNRAYAERLGLTPEEIVGKSIAEVLGEEASKAIRPHVENVLKGRPVEYETEVPYRQLGRRFMRVAYMPEKNAEGDVVGWVSALSDITERRQAEEMLRRRTRSLEIINRVGNVLAGELDLNRVVQMVTDAGREISGAQFGAFFYNVKGEEDESYMLYALSGAPREAFEKFPMPRNTPLFAPTFAGQGVLRIGDVLQDPRYGRNPHGGMPEGHLPVRSYLAVPVVSRSGEVLGGMLFGHPDTDVFTEAAENIITAVAAQSAIAIDNANLYQAVQRRVEEFRKLIDTAPVGIAVATDAECQHIWGNPEFAQMLGEDVSRNISKSAPEGGELSFKVLRDGREVAAGDLPMQRACRDGIDVLDEELEIVRGDGTILHELARATPLRDEQGRVRGCIGIFLNITDRKQAEAALQQAKDALARSNEELERRVQQRTAELERANAALLREMDEQKMLEDQLRQAQRMESIGTLAGGVAHDFNNLLNIIKGYASLLARRRPGDRELTEHLKVIDETVERGASTVRQLLAFGKNSEIRFEAVSINSVVEKLASLLAETFPRAIEIVSNLDPHLPPVMADPNQISQIMLNICVNARDSMPEGGDLILTTAAVPGADVRERFHEARDPLYACIGVADTGMGMNEAIRKRIFEPFFTTKDQGQGTGLGLSVVYGIVTKHGGFIDVASEPGSGTIFRVYLPVADHPAVPQEPDRPARAKPKQGARARGATILFVEDELKQLDVMRDFLESEGYKVLAARDGVEAFEAYLRHKGEIGVIVLDLGLPKLSGWEVFQQIKHLDPQVKPILATGYISPDMESAVAKGELAAVIMKPYKLDEVLANISAVLEQPVNGTT